MHSFQFSLVIASKQPQKLSEFYAFATNGDLQNGEDRDHYLIVHQNGMNIQIYRPSEKRSFSNPSRRSALCLQKPPSVSPLIVIKEWSNTMLLIFTELVNFIAGINKYSGYFDDIDETGQWFTGINKILKEFMNIFIKNGRSLYIGLTLILISFSLYLIQITS